MPFTGKTFETLTKERQYLHALVDSFGFELLEQFIGYQNATDFETKDYNPSYIVAKDKNFLKMSDVVIADFSFQSIGVDCEVILAKELFYKKVYAIVPQGKRKHPWLNFYCDYFLDSVPEALEQITTDFASRTSSATFDKRQYDPLAVEYRLIEETPAQKYIYDPILQDFLASNAEDKRIIVLHCGTGHRARMAKRAGAAEVVGIDLSPKQIYIAREEEVQEPLGIDYITCDPYSTDFIAAIPPELLGSADIVVGCFLLDHAMNRRELSLVSRNIARLLKQHGFFFALSDNPDACMPSDNRYGIVLSCDVAKEQLEEGMPRKVSIFQQGREVLHFHNFLWRQETVRQTFADYGFETIAFDVPHVSSKGIEEYGKEFWNAYNACPDQITILAQKGP